jgi:ankyrin repeat protein
MKNFHNFKIIFCLMPISAAENVPQQPANLSWADKQLINAVSNTNSNCCTRLPLTSLRNFCVKAALFCGADPNTKDQFGMTALHHAAQNDNVQQIRQLVAARANLDLPDRYGSLPIDFAIITGNQAASTELINQIKNRFTSSAVECLQKRNQFNQAPLHMAAAFNRNLTVAELLAAGVHPDGITTAASNLCKMPLHYAAENCNIKLMHLLQAYGANIYALDPIQGTVFHILARKDHPESRKCLESFITDPAESLIPFAGQRVIDVACPENRALLERVCSRLQNQRNHVLRLYKAKENLNKILASKATAASFLKK